MAIEAKLFQLALLLAVIGVNKAAPGRIVQLVAENPSPFVSADPNDPKYIVTLFNDIEKAEAVVPKAPSIRSTIMTNAAGQQFNCSVPSSPPGAETALSQLDPDTTPAYNLIKSPFELLESLVGLCMYRQDGLWTYEVCHRSHVRQFRQVSFQPGSIVTLPDASAANGLFDAVLSGDVNKVLGQLLPLLPEGSKKAEDFSCGQYTGDDSQSEAIQEDTSSSGHPLKYVSHRFTGGANCVLTGQPRSAEVRYTCVRDNKENVVLSVREFPTCNYVVVVSTPFLCKHPAFVPMEEDVRLISCMPLHKQPSDEQQGSSQLLAAATRTAAAGAAVAGPLPQPVQHPAGADAPVAAAAESSGRRAAEESSTPAGAPPPRRLKGAQSPAYVEDDDDDDEEQAGMLEELDSSGEHTQYEQEEPRQRRVKLPEQHQHKPALHEHAQDQPAPQQPGGELQGKKQQRLEQQRQHGERQLELDDEYQQDQQPHEQETSAWPYEEQEFYHAHSGDADPYYDPIDPNAPDDEASEDHSTGDVDSAFDAHRAGRQEDHDAEGSDQEEDREEL